MYASIAVVARCSFSPKLVGRCNGRRGYEPRERVTREPEVDERAIARAPRRPVVLHSRDDDIPRTDRA